ncbi:MAG TPA: DUF4124 domain-containing protein [Solimonas sp.]|nr:DUF4124 domain-containing protein [Solimonas sp.]
MRTARGLLTLLTGLALATPAMAAGVYRWVDKDGVVHYDDQSRRSSTPVTREYMEQRRMQSPPRAQSVVPPDILADVQLRCSSGRDRLETYSGAGRVYGRDRSGRVHQLSAEQLRQELLAARIQVERFCAADAGEHLLAEEQAEARREEQRQARALEAARQRARTEVQQR